MSSLLIRCLTLGNNHTMLHLYERQVKVIGNMITTHLIDQGSISPLFTPCSAYARNTLATASLDGFSPYELLFIRKLPD